MGVGDTGSAPKTGAASAKTARPSRRLKLSSRMRVSWWKGVDHLLGADFLWSAVLIMVIVLALGVQSCGHEYERFEVGQLAGGIHKLTISATDLQTDKNVEKSTLFRVLSE